MGKKGAKKSSKQAPVKRKQNPLTVAVVVIILLAMVGFVALGMFGTGQKSSSENMTSNTSPGDSAKKGEWEVLNSYPHDPDAFWQGLEWYDNGFYEGTRLYGNSPLIRLEFASRKVLRKI